MNIVDTALFRYTLALREPLVLSRGTLTERQGLLVRLMDDLGYQHWGEAAPLPGFSRETLDTAEAQLMALAEVLRSLSWNDALREVAGRRARLAASVCCALDMALVPDMTPAEGRHAIASAYLLPVEPNEIPSAARTAAAAGYSRLKLKVGRRDLEEEAALACRVAATLPPGVSLRLDANRAWDLPSARAFCAALDFVPDFLEEPLQNAREIPDLAAHSSVPLALDESLAEPELESTIEHLLPHVRALVWKPTLCAYSLHDLLAIAGKAEAPVQLVVSAAFESGVALCAFTRYAASLPGHAPAGIDTYRWLAADVLYHPLPLPAPSIALSALADCAVDESRLLQVL